jgi:membrane peptidoglycan carboxypeptidase
VASPLLFCFGVRAQAQRGGLVGLIVLMAMAGAYATSRAVAITRGIAAELDEARSLAALTPRAQASLVFDRAGHPAFSFFAEQRIDVPLDRVSPHMIAALLAVEDRRFYSHHGVDPLRIAAAAWRNFRAGRIREGGSTITQQLARATVLSPDRTYARKLREILIASRLEQRYTKAQILEAYLNTVYFGEGYYGVEAASRGYFGKRAADLATHEAALLAALVRSPSTDAPCTAPARATRSGATWCSRSCATRGGWIRRGVRGGPRAAPARRLPQVAGRRAVRRRPAGIRALLPGGDSS